MQFQRAVYLILMLLALAVFLALRYWQPNREAMSGRLSVQQQWTLTLAAFIGGALGAKLPFVLGQSWAWWSGTLWLSDGKTITTGLAGAYLAVEVVKFVLDIRVKTGDGFALPLAGALAIGRWGCFFNGCCYGVPTTLPWGVDFLADGLRHPTQAYESFFHLTMACILGWLIATQRLRYQKLKLYLICYCGYRFFSEWIRPEPTIIAGLTFYQCFSLVFGVALGVQWWLDHRKLQSTVSLAVSTRP
ncbi:MAG: prolipoprotein diacylglyceryl transferase [Pirellulaceae bacterium]